MDKKQYLLKRLIAVLDEIVTKDYILICLLNLDDKETLYDSILNAITMGFSVSTRKDDKDNNLLEYALSTLEGYVIHLRQKYVIPANNEKN